MHRATPRDLSPRPSRLLSALPTAFATLLLAAVLGLAAPALATSAGGPDYSSGTAGTSGSADHPQPLSRADHNSGGANGQCPGAAYCSTRDGSASQNGRGDTRGHARAQGKPCAGCVGRADNKVPPGQRPDGSDRNAGYECDRNQGIGQSNPAHTGCSGSTTGTTSSSTPSSTTSSSTTAAPPASAGTPPLAPGTTSGATPDDTVPGVATSAPETSASPHCSGPMNGLNTGQQPPAPCAGVLTSGPLTPVVLGGASMGDTVTAITISATVPHAPTVPAGTAAEHQVRAGTPAPQGILPNTGAPAYALLLLVGAVALLGGGTWVVRRQLP